MRAGFVFLVVFILAPLEVFGGMMLWDLLGWNPDISGGCQWQQQAGVSIMGMPTFGGEQTTCTFTNHGGASGSICATVELHGVGGQVRRASRICSGKLEPNTSTTQPVMFLEASEGFVCRSSDGCEMEIVNQVRERHGIGPIEALAIWFVGGVLVCLAIASLRHQPKPEAFATGLALGPVIGGGLQLMLDPGGEDEPTDAGGESLPPA